MKCPVCNSTTFRGTEHGKRCEKCGYVWKGSTVQDTHFAKDYRYGSDEPNAIPLIDYHNVSYKFKILGDEGMRFPVEKVMRGWVQQWTYEEGFKALKTPANVIIFLDKRFKIRMKSFKDLDQLDEKIKNKIIVAARMIQNKYHLVLDINNPIALRKEIKLEEGFKSPIQMQTENIKVVYPDGTVEFISVQAVQHFKNFFRNMAALDKVSELENNLAEFAANWKMHKQILLDMTDAIRELRKPSIFSRVRFTLGNFFNSLRSAVVKEKTVNRLLG